MPKSPPHPISTPIPELQGIASIAERKYTPESDHVLVKECVAALRQREVQAIGAAISNRCWQSVEAAYSQLRDKMDRPEWITIPARDGIEAQHGLNDVFPGDPVKVRAAARPTPADDAERRAIPEGMVPWHGGERAPQDWDRGPVRRRRGVEECERHPRWYWATATNGCNPEADIIAYTPKPRTTEARLREVIKAALMLEPPYNDLPPSERPARLTRVERTLRAALEAERGS